MTKYYCVLMNNSHPIALDTYPDGTSIEFTENPLWAEDECKDFGKRNPDCTYEVKEVLFADPVPHTTLEEILGSGAGHAFVSSEFSRIYTELRNRCAEFIPDSDTKAHNVWLLSSRIINLLFSTHFSMGMRYGENEIRYEDFKK